MMKILLYFIIILILFISCTSKNPTIKTGIKKQTQEYINLASEQYKKGIFKESKIFLQQALKNSFLIDDVEQIIIIYLNLIQVCIELNELDEARNYLSNVDIIMNNENITNYLFQYNLVYGNYFDKIGNIDESFKYYEFGLKFAFSDIEKGLIYQKLGYVFQKYNKFDEAIKYLEEAKNIFDKLVLFDKLATIYYYFGEVYEKNENYDLSLSNYFIALKFDKTNENPIGIFEDLKKIGCIYKKNGKVDLSKYYFYRALKIAENINDDKRIEEIKSYIK